MQSLVIRALVTLLAVFNAGCANLTAGNIFSHYSAQNDDVHQAVLYGNYKQAEESLSDQVAGPILDNMEKGRVYFLNADYKESKSAFESADLAVRKQQDQAVISVSETTKSLSALAVNDNFKTYEPADYELGFLHLYLGLTYVQKNQLDGALVEMRRANQVQEKARKDREGELKADQKQMSAQGLSPNLGSILANYPDAGSKLQAVQNGYLFYLSALLYEANRDLNNAYVDYRRALAVAPNNLEVIRGTMRVAQRLGMRNDLKLLEKQYGQVEPLPASKSRIVILDERGVVDSLDSWKLSLPLYDSRGNGALYSIALPYYSDKLRPSFPPLSLNGSKADSNLIADVDLMASQSLSERLPSIIIRQALRVWAKDMIRKSLTDEENIGSLLVNVWNTLTEQPDTRSWLTLPSQIYTSSMVVNPGMQTVSVGGQEYNFELQAGNTALVWLSRQGAHATIWHKQLGNIK